MSSTKRKKEKEKEGRGETEREGEKERGVCFTSPRSSDSQLKL